MIMSAAILLGLLSSYIIFGFFYFGFYQKRHYIKREEHFKILDAEIDMQADIVGKVTAFAIRQKDLLMIFQNEIGKIPRENISDSLFKAYEESFTILDNEEAKYRASPKAIQEANPTDN